MRKFLLFLLLLGAGLYLLYWLDQRGRASDEPSETLPPGPEASGKTQGLQAGGRSQVTWYDRETKRPLARVESADTRTEAGVDLLTGVVVELLDPDAEGVVQLRLHAERARLERVAAEGQLQPEWEMRLPLEGVRAEVLAGVALAPLTFETETALIDVSDPAARRVESEAAFQARSPELTLAGRGLDWDIDAERLVIRHGGRVELVRAGAAPASFTALGDGPLEVRRAEGKEGPVTLEAWQGVVLEPGTATPGRLAARHVALRARPGAGPEEPLAIESLDADGDVDWTSGEARFQGQHLAASFAALGRLERARLEGEPRAELALALSPSVLPAADPEEQRLVVLEGQDALDITWKEGGYELHMESTPAAPGGPAPERVPSIVTRDFRLQSAATIAGWLAEDQRSARFRAGGGVVVTSGEASLETATFEVEIAPDALGETVLTGTASGGARLEGKLPPAPGEDRPGDPAPRTFTLTSPDGLKLERSARGWRVIEGTRVEVALEDPGGFRARAEHLRDFVVPRSGSGALAPEGLRFVASGAVRVDFENGRFGGEELEVFAVAPVPHFVLRGTRASKAFFQGEPGEASALEVEVTGKTYQARGEVTGSGEFVPSGKAGAVRTTFAGDTATLDVSQSPELIPGERLRTLRALVEGHVQCSVAAADQTVVLRCARFSAENRARLVQDAPAPLELGSLFIAEGQVHADFLEPDSELAVDCERFELERTASDVESGFRQLIASGNVRFRGHYAGGTERRDVDLGGECETLVLDSDRRGSLEAGPRGRVFLYGRAPGHGAPLRLTAERVDFELPAQDVLRLLALRPELRMLGLRARAEHFTADEKSGVMLSGSVRVSGATAAHVPYTLDADEVVLVGRRRPGEGTGAVAGVGLEEEGSERDIADELDALSARGNVVFQLSDELSARGDRLAIRRSTGLLRLDGAPASFELGNTVLETEWVEFDPDLQMLVGTGRGRVSQRQLGAAPAAQDEWALDFLSISTLLELDSVILVVQEPYFRTAQFQSSLRASWAILWLNRQGFENTDRRSELLDGLQQVFERMRAMPEGTSPSERLQLFRSAELSSLLREVYFEGPVEVLAENELLARADAIYLDITSQHGWLAGATVHLGDQFLGQRQERMVVKAKWLRLSSDGSLRADRATLTSCSFDDPHVSVVTGDLEIEPVREPGKAHYQFRLEDNRVELYGKMRIPLPTIEFATDEELKPILPTLSLANSARFGTLFGFAFTRPADNVGELFDSIARPEDESSKPGAPAKPRSDVDANWKVDGSYLGSRGALLDLGLEIEAKEDYWFDLYLGLAYDTGDDKGFIEIDEDERDSLRRWLRSQAYFERGRSAWSFSYSDQSDAAVQSEFYEGQFLRYERSETYLQWRRSRNENFVQGSAKVRVDSFRSDVEELPSLSGYHGRAPLARFGPLALLWTGDLRAEYLRRRTGDEPHSPFESGPTFGDVDPDDFGGLDGLGDREVLRVDTQQALELPVALGAGWKLTPFVSARGSAWNEGVEEEDSPTRALAEGGVRLGAAFWKRTAGGRLHQLAPFVEYRAELDRSDEDGTPVEFDEVERVLSGDFLRAGVRGRFDAGAEGSLLDVDLVAGHGSDFSDGRPDGWLPLEVFARLLVQPAGQEFEIFHDARYDFEEQRTVYSLVSFGTHFGEQWGLQFSHQRGVDNDYQALFEAASVAGLYRWSEKWEFEARESFSLLEDEGLDTEIGIRRYGHDLVFELEGGVREGEGTSVGLSVKPRFGYHPPRVGYVPW